ncbi:MAG: hypothetical protein A3F76_13135 [Burkholderiales bacterium RIFCSPLOWO2_12_FULL_65_40]|nr:MAG: hypothetical protein A3F76_13135 [Burkholderiales bacterium RIFCSPLOWO2_12_FULL_65_40]
MVKQAHMFRTLDKVSDPDEAQPESFHAGFAIMLAAEEPAEHGDLANYLAQGWRFGRWFLLRQQVSPLPLRFGEECAGIHVWMGTSQTDQSCQTPGNDHIHRQRQFQFGYAAQLQGLHPATEPY